VHTAIDSFKLVTLPDAATTTFSLLLIGVSLIVPLARFRRSAVAGQAVSGR
jgi:hypothetical protein